MNGIILIDKPKGKTSHDIVKILKKMLDVKVGHAGTLDPIATGVLPILIGKGTLISKYLINHDKSYEVVLALGKKTDTSDAEGRIVEEEVVDKKILNKEYILNMLKSFIGKQEQIPPMYSAIKIKGKKLYEYARNKEQVEVTPRSIQIYSLKLDKVLDNNDQELEIHFTVACSKGTYVRSLCEDIASKLGTIGYMKELKRIKVGNYSIEDSFSLEEIIKEDNFDKKDIYDKIISIEELFKSKKELTLKDKEVRLFLNGVKLTKKLKNDLYRIYDNTSKFIGLGIITNKLLKRDVVL